MSFNCLKKDYYNNRHLSILRESPEDMFLNGEHSEDIYVNFNDTKSNNNVLMKSLPIVRPNKPPPPLPPDVNIEQNSTFMHQIRHPPPPTPLRDVETQTLLNSNSNSSANSNMPDILECTSNLSSPHHSEIVISNECINQIRNDFDVYNIDFNTFLSNYIQIMHDTISWTLPNNSLINSQADINRFEARRNAEKECYQLLLENIEPSIQEYYIQVFGYIQQLRNYCETLRVISQYHSLSELNNYLDYEPLEASCSLMKMSFNEDYRRIICHLGGLEALAQLIVINNAVLDDINHTYHLTMRRYACMALTNLTFGMGHNKSFLCSCKPILDTLVRFLTSSSEDLKQVAASVIRNLSWKASSQIKQQLSQSNTASILTTQSMYCAKESALKSLLSALWNVSSHSTDNKIDICRVNGSIGYFVQVLSYKTIALVENAGGILRNIASVISTNEDFRSQLAPHEKFYHVLLKLLRSPSLTIVGNCCGILSQLTAPSQSSSPWILNDLRLLWQLGAVAQLKNLINSRHKSISYGSAQTLNCLLNCRHDLDIPEDTVIHALGLSSPPNINNNNNNNNSCTSSPFIQRKLTSLQADIQSVLQQHNQHQSPSNNSSINNNNTSSCLATGQTSSSSTSSSNSSSKSSLDSSSNYACCQQLPASSPSMLLVGNHQAANVVASGNVAASSGNQGSGGGCYDYYDSDTSEKPLDYSIQFGDVCDEQSNQHHHQHHYLHHASNIASTSGGLLHSRDLGVLPTDAGSTNITSVSAAKEQPHVYATEDTPISSRVSPTSMQGLVLPHSSHEDEGDGDDNNSLHHKTNPNHNGGSSNKKSVTFTGGAVPQSSVTTPLMFSRQSSCASLDSEVGVLMQSLHSSVPSVYTTETTATTSEMVSPVPPSELLSPVSTAGNVKTTTTTTNTTSSSTGASARSSGNEATGGGGGGLCKNELIAQCIASGMNHTNKAMPLVSCDTRLVGMTARSSGNNSNAGDNQCISYAVEGTPFNYSTNASSLSDISISEDNDVTKNLTKSTVPEEDEEEEEEEEEHSELLSEIIQSAMPTTSSPIIKSACAGAVSGLVKPGFIKQHQYFYCEHDIDSPRQYGVEGTPINFMSQRESICSDTGPMIIQYSPAATTSASMPPPPAPLPPIRTSSTLSSRSLGINSNQNQHSQNNNNNNTNSESSNSSSNQHNSSSNNNEEVCVVYMTENTPANYSRASPVQSCSLDLSNSAVNKELEIKQTQESETKTEEQEQKLVSPKSTITKTTKSPAITESSNNITPGSSGDDKSSLSSLSIESAGMERTLLQQCISSAMPTPKLKPPANYSQRSRANSFNNQNPQSHSITSTSQATQNSTQIPLVANPTSSNKPSAITSPTTTKLSKYQSSSTDKSSNKNPPKSKSSSSLKSALNPCFKAATNKSISLNASSSSSSSDGSSSNCSFLVNGFDVNTTVSTKPESTTSNSTNNNNNNINTPASSSCEVVDFGSPLQLELLDLAEIDLSGENTEDFLTVISPPIPPAIQLTSSDTNNNTINSDIETVLASLDFEQNEEINNNNNGNGSSNITTCSEFPLVDKKQSSNRTYLGRLSINTTSSCSSLTNSNNSSPSTSSTTNTWNNPTTTGKIARPITTARIARPIAAGAGKISSNSSNNSTIKSNIKKPASANNNYSRTSVINKTKPASSPVSPTGKIPPNNLKIARPIQAGSGLRTPTKLASPITTNRSIVSPVAGRTKLTNVNTASINRNKDNTKLTNGNTASIIKNKENTKLANSNTASIIRNKENTKLTNGNTAFLNSKKETPTKIGQIRKPSATKTNVSRLSTPKNPKPKSVLTKSMSPTEETESFCKLNDGEDNASGGGLWIIRDEICMDNCLKCEE